MKFALIGYGKMGKAIEEVILERQEQGLPDEIVLKITSKNLSDLTEENLRKADVVIEFTQPEAAIENIYKCFDAGVPVVVGTTAWLNKLNEVKQVCEEKDGALFYAPNFSIGVNIFFEINRHLARIMNDQPQYELAIEETHHTEKKDAPSGTAIKTAEVILGEYTRKKDWELQDDVVYGENIPVIAKREPNVPGTHIVQYSSSVDKIELIHEAKTRRGFAEGSVLAARWLVGKRGVFDMKDLLKF